MPPVLIERLRVARQALGDGLLEKSGVEGLAFSVAINGRERSMHANLLCKQPPTSKAT